MTRAVIFAAVASVCWSLGITNANADAMAYSCRAKSLGSGTIETVRGPGGCTGFVVKDGAGRVRYRGSLGASGSGEYVLAADGVSVAFIHSFPYAGLRPGGALAAYGPRVGGRAPELYGVVLFRRGRMLARHRLVDLLVRTRMVSESTSHVRWLRSAPVFTKDRLTLVTTSLRELTFDLKTGALLAATDTSEWTGCDGIAYGDIKGHGRWRQMAPAYSAKGNMPRSVSFDASALRRVPSGYHAMCFVKRNGRWRATAVYSRPMLNGLTYP